MNSPKGLFYAIISSSTFGLVPLFAIPALQAGIPLNSVVFYRFLFSSILLGIILCIRKTNFKISGKQALIIFGLAFLYAATSLLLTKSYLYIPSGLATTLHFLYPVLVTLLMVTFFKDKVSVSFIIATIMAIGGVYLLSGSEGGTLNSTGLALALTTRIDLCLLYRRNKQIERKRYGRFKTHVLRFTIGCIHFLVELNRKSGNAYSHTLLGNRR